MTTYRTVGVIELIKSIKKVQDMYYPIDYGYVESIIAPDGEEQEKWVVAPGSLKLTKDQIREKVRFTEQFFDSEVIM